LKEIMDIKAVKYEKLVALLIEGIRTNKNK
jgi:hypothetical protein